MKKTPKVMLCPNCIEEFVFNTHEKQPHLRIGKKYLYFCSVECLNEHKKDSKRLDMLFNRLKV